MSSILKIEGNGSLLNATIVMEAAPEDSVDTGEVSSEQIEETMKTESADTETEVEQPTPEDMEAEEEAPIEEEATDEVENGDETLMPEEDFGGMENEAGMEGMEGMDGMEGMYPGMEVPQAKESVMASWVFVIGITAAVLALGIVCGILLGKKRIKKGFDDYED